MRHLNQGGLSSEGGTVRWGSLFGGIVSLGKNAVRSRAIIRTGLDWDILKKWMLLWGCWFNHYDIFF
jgi:hypothetical protein